jgi:4-aminobutyrate aminotransferase/(S)-3-amino-2-methylpropionate transaminase
MTSTASAASVVTQERKVVTAIPGPKSVELHARRKEVVPPGVGAMLPVYIEYGHDAILRDVDGNQFIDMVSGIGVTTIGHSNAAVAAAVTEQVNNFTHTLFTMTPYEGYVQVAENIAQHAPITGATRTFLCNSGSEAVENAVKIARKFTGKGGIAVLDYAYHGRTNLTMAMNYKHAPYANGYGPLGTSVFRAPGSYPFRDGLTGPEAAKRTIETLEKVVGADDLACLVVEPIIGEGGFIVPADGYLQALLEWCHKNNVVFVADEVQSGMGRTGYYFASESFDFTPDIFTFAKGIAGGLPLAGVAGRADIMDASHPGGLGGTFGGNPISCAASVAVFNEIEKEDLLSEAKRIEKTLGEGLRGLAAKYDVIGDVRGKGAMLAIEFVDPATNEPNAAAVEKVIAYAAQQGVLLLNAGASYNVIRFLPSFKISDELINDVVGVLDDALAAL